MKIRNGFVSNSSSSSFILVYDKNKILNGPEEIVNFLEENPNEKIIISGCSLSDGMDYFEVDNDIAKEIRLFSNRFIENNKNLVDWKWNYEKNCSEHIPLEMKGYYGNDATLAYDENFYDWSLSDEELEKEQEKRLHSFVNGNNDLNAIHVLVDRNSTDDSYDFSERYLTKEYEEDYSNYTLRIYKGNDRPYAIVYKECIKDKNEIIKKLSENNLNVLLTRFNEIFSYECESNVTNLFLYKMEDTKKKLILDNAESFIKNNNEVLMFTEATVVDMECEVSGKLSMWFGRYTLVDDSKCKKEFKEDFLTY